MQTSKQRLYFLLQNAAHVLRKQTDASMLEKSGLTTAQAFLLLHVAKSGPVSQKYLAEQLSLHESAVTQMVGRLIKNDYVTKARSQTDGRAWDIQITEKGRGALRRAQAAMKETNKRLETALAETDIEAFANSIKSIIAFAKDGADGK